MMVSYSTQDHHPRDRLSFWVDVVTKVFFRHSFRPKSARTFHGELHGGAVGCLKVAHCRLDPGEAQRSAREQAQDDVDDIFLGLRLSGESVVDQAGRQAIHAPGAIVLLDTRLPGATTYAARSESVFATVPRAALEARLGNLAPLIARPIASGPSVAGLAAGFLSLLATRAGSFDAASGSRLAEQALDLLALAYSKELALPRLALSSARATALLQLKSVIEARLHEPDLSPSAIATEAGISVRYANALLAQEGSSIERYILLRRLERCRQALEDATQAHRMIGDIAFSWGFSDLSHFGRRFRAAYGMTPGDYRRRAREAASA